MQYKTQVCTSRGIDAPRNRSGFLYVHVRRKSNFAEITWCCRTSTPVLVSGIRGNCRVRRAQHPNFSPRFAHWKLLSWQSSCQESRQVCPLIQPLGSLARRPPETWEKRSLCLHLGWHCPHTAGDKIVTSLSWENFQNFTWLLHAPTRFRVYVIMRSYMYLLIIIYLRFEG